MPLYNILNSSISIDYLFVDGAYLRNRLDSWSKTFFCGEKITVDFIHLTSGYQKVFYYDCLPAIKQNESQVEYDSRIQPQKDNFNRLRELDRFHVYEGTTSGIGGKARQKQIDIMIAVHMLSHTIRRNMTKATLLTGDLDFKPLIDTLIQEGMFVTLWCEKSSTSKDLVYSADSRRGLDLWSIWNLTTKDFQLRNPIPKAFSQPGINSNGFTLVKSGTSSLGGEAYLYQNENSQFMIVYRDFMNDGYFIHWQYKDQDILERLLKVKEDGVTFEWSS